jgi:hypothetical protein
MFRRTIGSIVLFSLAWVGGARADSWSYADLDHVLGRYVSEDGLVDYHGLASDHGPLDRFVEALARSSPDNRPDLFSTEADRLAYWMNAYNALMLARVVEAWPVESVREIKPLYGVFWAERHTLGGERWTLQGLENKVIRKRFRDPRIHFAINCASAGCPALPAQAWRPETLDADLDAAARRFVADPEKVAVDERAGVIRLSRIFKWFEKDFTGWLEDHRIDHPNGVVDYVARYLPEERRDRFDPSRLRIEWMDYDWAINLQPEGPGPR